MYVYLFFIGSVLAVNVLVIILNLAIRPLYNFAVYLKAKLQSLFRIVYKFIKLIFKIILFPKYALLKIIAK